MNEGQYKVIPLDKLSENPNNPRDAITEDQALTELTNSIQEVGILVPLLVRSKPDDPKQWEVIDGDRRRVAAHLAGLTEVPAVVREMEERDAAESGLIANLQRENLEPLEEASGLQQLLDRGWDVRSISAHLGRAPKWILRRARLTELTDDWRKTADDERHWAYGWPAPWLELIARYPAETQEQLLKDDICADSLAKLERHLATITLELRKAPWKLDDAVLDPQAGACLECTKRSDRSPGLFDDLDASEEKLKKGAKCLDQACWRRKATTLVDRKAAELEKKHGKVVKVCERYGRTKDAVSPHDMKNAKKGDAGAAICLRIDGPKAGSTFWAVPQEWARKATVKASEKPNITPLKERRARLERQREALVNKALEELAGKICQGDLSEWYTDEILLRTLAVFGTPHKSVHIGAPEWDKIKKESVTAARLALWFAVLEQLLERLRTAGQSLSIPGNKSSLPWEEHDRIAEFLRFDTEVLREKAAKAKPEPKSWASLNADGTPKKAKLAGGKKKATASAEKKPAAKKKPERKPPARYLAKERAELVAKYKELVERALTIDGKSITKAAEVAAKEVGVPVATLERWAK